MPLKLSPFHPSGALLVRPDVSVGLTQDDNCCCPFTCAEFIECFTTPSGVVTLSNWTAGALTSCTDCGSMNDSWLIDGYTLGSCFLNKTIPIGVCEERDFEISLAFGFTGGNWTISVLVTAIGTSYSWVLTGDTVRNALYTACVSGSSPVIDVPFSSGAGSSAGCVDNSVPHDVPVIIFSGA